MTGFRRLVAAVQHLSGNTGAKGSPQSVWPFPDRDPKRVPSKRVSAQILQFCSSHMSAHVHMSDYRARGWTIRGSRVRFPAGAGNFSLHHRVQNGSGAHPAPYPMGIRGSFPGGKAAGA
jgi:hypothetical protein